MVLAHPNGNLKNHDQIILIIRAGIDGIEAFSSCHTPTQAFDYIEQPQIWYNYNEFLAYNFSNDIDNV